MTAVSVLVVAGNIASSRPKAMLALDSSRLSFWPKQFSNNFVSALVQANKLILAGNCTVIVWYYV